MTHIYVSELTTMGSDYGLSPGKRQVIIWTNAGVLVIGHLVRNFSEMVIRIHTFLFKKILLKMSSGKRPPSYLGFNVLSFAREHVYLYLLSFIRTHGSGCWYFSWNKLKHPQTLPEYFGLSTRMVNLINYSDQPSDWLDLRLCEHHWKTTSVVYVDITRLRWHFSVIRLGFVYLNVLKWPTFIGEAHTLNMQEQRSFHQLPFY